MVDPVSLLAAPDPIEVLRASSGLTAEEMDGVKFHAAGRREIGYAARAVDEWLRELGVRLDAMWNDVALLFEEARRQAAEATEAARAAEAPAAPVGPSAEELGKAWVAAHETIDRLLADARSEADRIVSEASARASELEAKAAARAEELRAEAESLRAEASRAAEEAKAAAVKEAEAAASEAKAAWEALRSELTRRLEALSEAISDHSSPPSPFANHGAPLRSALP